MTDWLRRARVREAAAHRRQHAARKAAGLCGHCGGKRAPGRLTCRKAVDDNRAWRARRKRAA